MFFCHAPVVEVALKVVVPSEVKIAVELAKNEPAKVRGLVSIVKIDVVARPLSPMPEDNFKEPSISNWLTAVAPPWIVIFPPGLNSVPGQM